MCDVKTQSPTQTKLLVGIIEVSHIVSRSIIRFPSTLSSTRHECFVLFCGPDSPTSFCEIWISGHAFQHYLQNPVSPDGSIHKKLNMSLENSPMHLRVPQSW